MAQTSAVAHPATEPAREAGTSIELFSGAGGLVTAMTTVGFRHLLINERDSRACETLRLNGARSRAEVTEPRTLEDPWPLLEGDVHEVDFTEFAGRVDVLAGGVPCQPWSLGGAHRGNDDDRNLWPQFARAVRETAPRALMAENVRGLLRKSFEPYWAHARRCLEMPYIEPRSDESWSEFDERLQKEARAKSFDPAERYRVTVHPVNAADYGVPQLRHRVITVGVRCDITQEFVLAEPTHGEGALLAAMASGKYWDEHGLPRPAAPAAPPAMTVDGEKKPWRTLRDALHGLPEPGAHKVETPGFTHHYGWDGAREYPGHRPNRLDWPAKTVKAGVHGVAGGECVLRRDDGQIRYMTVREVARVMTFADAWRLAGPRSEQMRQLGNAVPLELGIVVARSLARVLSARPHVV